MRKPLKKRNVGIYYVCSATNIIILFHVFVKCLLHKLCDLEVEIIYELFRAEIDKAKMLYKQTNGRKLTNADIAKRTGYSLSSIEAFMAGNRPSENIAKQIATALNIEL